MSTADVRGRIVTPLCFIVSVAFMSATPVLSQGVTTGDRPEPESKVSKVDAITLKQTTTASVNAFLKIGDIKGGAREPAHRDEIEVLLWVWGEGGTPTRSSNTRPADGPGTLTITKPVDRSSPQLMQAAAKGTHFAQMTLTLPPQRQGGQSMTLTLENVTVSRVQPAGGRDRPTESIAFNYTKIKGVR